MGGVLRRFLLQNVTSWFRRKNRKPLVLRGARQVGKSTLVRLAAQNLDVPLFEVNLERHLRLDSVFSTLDTEAITRELEGILQKRIPRQGALLFLDEIQATPRALAALRYFYEDWPELAVIAAGSLLDLALGDLNASMPVGRVEYMHVGPMTFEEFLEARGEKWLLDAIQTYQLGQPWPAANHEGAIRLLRDYTFVGGMPEAVAAYCENGRESDEWVWAQQRIIDTYKDDFTKYTRRSALTPVLQGVYERLPARVGQKVKYADILAGERSSYVRQAIELLAGARVVHRAFHSDAQGVPLQATADLNIYKCYWLDIGLLNRLLGIPIELVKFDTKSVHEGPIAEQLVAQHLAYWQGSSVNPSLYYWLKSRKHSNAEVDFVVQLGTQIVPIEVKSARAGALKSLMVFIADRKLSFGIKTSLALPGEQKINHEISTSRGVERVQFCLVDIPIYMIEQARRLVEELVRRAL
jgi:uncharacterized protein